MLASAHDFKLVQAYLAGAVTIITTSNGEGQPRGFTATSFCSLSLDPPLVLFCLNTSADCYQAFLHNGHFAVNMLAEHQRDLSQQFATRGQAKYEGSTFFQGQLGIPLLADCLAYLECSIYATYPGGDHRIILGLVEHVYPGPCQSDARPLLYYSRSYGTFTSL